MADYTRLHITPLDESLLSVVVPASVLPSVRNVSYHTIETFPEKRYGFLDLPLADAEKLKKKLNGAVLRGAKMRIEQANKPNPLPTPTAEADPGADHSLDKKLKKKSSKRKRERDVIPAVELEDRKIKRGWTVTEQDMIKDKRDKSRRAKEERLKAKEKAKDDLADDDRKKKKSKSKEKRREVKSKYTDNAECLFKTKLPDTGAPSQAADATDGHKKKKRKTDREVVIHEFEKTTKHPSFLKAAAASSASEATTFQDGVGWVNSTGEVVESFVSKRPAHQPLPSAPKKQSAPSETASGQGKDEVPDDDTTSSSGTSSEDDDGDSDSSSQDDSESETADKEDEQFFKETRFSAPATKLKVDTKTLISPVASAKSESARPKSSGGSATSLKIVIPPSTPAKVHPLEALYKRPKGGDGAAEEAEKKSFSFFNDNEDEGEDEDEEEDDAQPPAPQIPMTPFTRQDFDHRNIRSAAPTPDTAHPSRSFNFWPTQSTLTERSDEDEEGEKEEEEEQDAGDVAMADGETGSPERPVSEFQKQFWETRGDMNRKWRKRRKTAAKEKRYRENRARADRAI